MAIFQTGSAVSASALLDIIVDFAVANGWTEVYNDVEGAGRRAHLQLDSDVFINFRATVNEAPNGVYSGAAYGISMAGSTSNSSSGVWCRQPGAPHNGADVDRIAIVGIANMTAVPAYYLFAREDMIYCWVEYSTGQYQFLYFGRISKVSTWTGGAIYGATSDGVGGGVGIANVLAGQTPFASIRYNPHAYMYASVDSHTGWFDCKNSDNVVPAKPHFFDTINKQYLTLYNLSNTFNGQAVLVPIELCITRDGLTSWVDSSNFSIEGYWPDIYFCNLRNLLPGQQLDDGSGDTFRALPFRSKTVNSADGTWFGVAIKEN